MHSQEGRHYQARLANVGAFRDDLKALFNIGEFVIEYEGHEITRSMLSGDTINPRIFLIYDELYKKASPKS